MKGRKILSLLIAVALVWICAMGVQAENSVIVIKKYSHGRLFLNSDKTEPFVTEDANSVFSYLYGDNGVFRNLNLFQNDWQMWTLDGTSPAVGEFAVGASEKYDGAIAFTPPGDCSVRIGSSMKIKIDEAQAENCDGAEFLLIQQRGEKFAPLWPSTDSFEGYNPKTQGKTILKDVYSHLNKGDKLLFVVRSLGTNTGDTIAVDPTVEIIEKEVSSPAEFFEWPEKVPSQTQIQQNADNTVFVSSGFINDGTENSENTSAPFTYRYGLNGDYSGFLPSREEKGDFIWKFEGDSGAPWASPWFLSACNAYDGVITFQAPESGIYRISNNQGDQLVIDTSSGNKGDGMAFAIIAENTEGGFYPVYPAAGVWRWQVLNEYDSAEFPDMDYYLNKGDKLHFIAHSKGEEINSVVIIDPKLTLENSSAKAVSYDYVEWNDDIETAVPESDTVRLCDYFNSKSPENSPITLMSGWDYEYSILDTYRADWGGWTSSGGATVGLNYLGAVSKQEAVVCYEAQESGKLTLRSDIPAVLDFPEQSDGLKLLVFVRNNNGDRPLWPVDGEWVYQQIIGSESVDFGEIKVNVRRGDKLFIVCRTHNDSSYDTVRVAPVFSLDTTTSGEIPEAVERIEPTDEYYISTLPDVGDLEIAKPAGNGMKVEKVIVFSIAAGIVVLGLIVVSVILIRRCKKKNGNNTQKE